MSNNWPFYNMLYLLLCLNFVSVYPLSEKQGPLWTWMLDNYGCNDYEAQERLYGYLNDEMRFLHGTTRKTVMSMIEVGFSGNIAKAGDYIPAKDYVCNTGNNNYYETRNVETTEAEPGALYDFGAKLPFVEKSTVMSTPVQTFRKSGFGGSNFEGNEDVKFNNDDDIIERNNWDSAGNDRYEMRNARPTGTFRNPSLEEDEASFRNWDVGPTGRKSSLFTVMPTIRKSAVSNKGSGGKNIEKNEDEGGLGGLLKTIRKSVLSLLDGGNNNKKVNEDEEGTDGTFRKSMFNKGSGGNNIEKNEDEGGLGGLLKTIRKSVLSVFNINGKNEDDGGIGGIVPTIRKSVLSMFNNNGRNEDDGGIGGIMPTIRKSVLSMFNKESQDDGGNGGLMSTIRKSVLSLFNKGSGGNNFEKQVNKDDGDVGGRMPTNRKSAFDENGENGIPTSERIDMSTFNKGSGGNNIEKKDRGDDGGENNIITPSFRKTLLTLFDI